jgi:hypothetical protein
MNFIQNHNIFFWTKVPISLILTLFFLFTIPFSGGCSDNVKEPSVAGTYYPSDANELKKMIVDFLSAAEKVNANGKLVALISPHAGYRYSGQVAAYGYKQLKESAFTRIILLGQSHRTSFKGASVYTKGAFKTPLGTVKTDVNYAEALLNESAEVKFLPHVFDGEHSLEVQLPFLQSVLSDFTIVPILIGSPTRKTFDHLVTHLTERLDEKTLIIASTDLSHDHDYQTAKKMDSKIVSSIERLSTVQTHKLLSSGEAELCGGYPVLITEEVARIAGANLGLVYKYANSGDITGDKDRVVGYASIGLIKNTLTENEKQELLGIARYAINEHVLHQKTSEIKINNPKFETDGAVFVTIKKKGALRGCIGHVHPIMPLYQSVIKNAISAASKDSRFPPLQKEELKDLEIEISIISPLQPLKNIHDIQIGKHGLVIRKGMQQGILLPQVATEYGWDRETFLDKLCAKAGLPEGAWKGADLYYFTAEIVK